MKDLLWERRFGVWRITPWKTWRIEYGRHTWGPRFSFGPITVYGYHSQRKMNAKAEGGAG